MDINKKVESLSTTERSLDNKSNGVVEHQEVKETLSAVSEGVNILSEGAETVSLSNKVSEESKKGAEGASQGGVAAGSGVVAQEIVEPSVEEMIAQTVQAIELELKEKEAMVQKMISNRNVTPYELNVAARELRFLNGLLFQLKNAAKSARDFVFGLWKQYVNKSS